MSKSKVEYERKIEIVQDYLLGKVGYAESVKRANNSVGSFRQWVAQYRTGGAAALLTTSKNKVYPQRLKTRGQFIHLDTTHPRC